MSRLTELFRDSAISLPFRKKMLLAQADRESEVVAEVAKKLRYKILGTSHTALDYARESRAEVFLLGSGASVCSLSESQWDLIDSGISIGFGPWALHTFIPDIYAFGPARGLRDYERVVSRVMNRADIIEARPEVFLLRSTQQEDIALFKSLPKPHHSRAHIYGRVTPIARRESQVGRELDFWFSGSMHLRREVAIDSGSTLVRLVSLCLAFGVKRIVLVGVDLNNVRYFWDSDPRFLKANGYSGFDTGQSGSVHDTVLPINRPLGVVSVLQSLQEIARRRFGASIEIMSETSLLSALLPQYSTS